VDEKLLPFAIQEFSDNSWVYGSAIPQRDRLYGAVPNMDLCGASELSGG
jgi:hypothetical protein